MSFTQHLGRGLTDQEIVHLNHVAAQKLKDSALQKEIRETGIGLFYGRESRFILQEYAEKCPDTALAGDWRKFVLAFLDADSWRFTKGQILLGVDFHNA